MIIVNSKIEKKEESLIIIADLQTLHHPGGYSYDGYVGEHRC
jgi:hypothetical protein